MYFLFMECLFLVMVIYFLFGMMFFKVDMENELMSSYECGFDINSFTRFVFSYRFFLISILFIIFDVEISLILPLPYLMYSNIMLIVFFMFMFILILGLFYEYKYGSLDWLDVNL
uniref:NADH-ubiquinone oxidoreductase chain 3 n=1 Tax=Oxytate striatipes TaxID=1112455 RepID=A0A0U1XKA6_OXYST|nr:NADH dehydrogenase subunit 3 [Oxytate striatipes]AIT96923.1 NADH dehydrogenase subunit 3 [Oxytate striatipes]